MIFTILQCRQYWCFYFEEMGLGEIKTEVAKGPGLVAVVELGSKPRSSNYIWSPYNQTYLKYLLDYPK